MKNNVIDEKHKLREFTYEETLKLVKMETQEFLAEYIYKIDKTYNLLIDRIIKLQNDNKSLKGEIKVHSKNSNNRYKAIKIQEKRIAKLNRETQKYFDMMMDNYYNRLEIDADLKDMIISALRYALRRKTYITLATAEYIMKHPELIDERVRGLMIRDLTQYFEERKLWEYKDDECDYQSWLNLYNWLKEEK